MKVKLINMLIKITATHIDRQIKLVNKNLLGQGNHCMEYQIANKIFGTQIIIYGNLMYSEDIRND